MVGVVLPLALFVALASGVREVRGFFFDEPLLWYMREFASPRLDAFFVCVSRLGYGSGVIPLDALIVLLLLALRRWRAAAFAGIGFVGSALLNVAAKHFFARARPGLWESIAAESSFSFPSAHAMGSATLAVVVIALAWRTGWRWPALLLAVSFVWLVGISRVYLGVHYPSDVLAGWAAGLIWVVGTYLLMFEKVDERSVTVCGDRGRTQPK